MDVESLQRRYWEFLELMKERFSGSIEHIILKTTTSKIGVHMSLISISNLATQLRQACGRRLVRWGRHFST